MLGEAGRRGRREQTGQDARRADGEVAAPGEHRSGEGHRGHDGHQSAGTRPAHEPGVPSGGTEPLQLVVDQRLTGAGAERSPGAPQHEADGEGGVRGDEHPQGEAGGGEQRGEGEQPAPGGGVGPGAGRDLQ